MSEVLMPVLGVAFVGWCVFCTYRVGFEAGVRAERARAKEARWEQGNGGAG